MLVHRRDQDKHDKKKMFGDKRLKDKMPGLRNRLHLLMRMEKKMETNKENTHAYTRLVISIHVFIYLFIYLLPVL